MNQQQQQQLNNLSTKQGGSQKSSIQNGVESQKEYAIHSERARIHLRLQKFKQNITKEQDAIQQKDSSQQTQSVTQVMTQTKLRASTNKYQHIPFTVNHHQQLQIPLEMLRPNGVGVATLGNKTQSSSQSKVLAGHKNMGPPDQLSKIFFNQNHHHLPQKSNQFKNDQQSFNASLSSPITDQQKTQQYRLPQLSGAPSAFSPQDPQRSSSILTNQPLTDYLEDGVTSPQQSFSVAVKHNSIKDEAILRIANQVSKRSFFGTQLQTHDNVFVSDTQAAGQQSRTNRKTRYLNKSVDLDSQQYLEHSFKSPVAVNNSYVAQSSLLKAVGVSNREQRNSQKAMIQSLNWPLGGQDETTGGRSSHATNYQFDRKNLLKPATIGQAIEIQSIVGRKNQKAGPYVVARSRSQFANKTDHDQSNGVHSALSVPAGVRNVVKLQSLSNAQVALEPTATQTTKGQKGKNLYRYATQDTQTGAQRSSLQSPPTIPIYLNQSTRLSVHNTSPYYPTKDNHHQFRNQQITDIATSSNPKTKQQNQKRGGEKTTTTIKIDGNKISLNDSVSNVLQLLQNSGSPSSIDHIHAVPQQNVNSQSPRKHNLQLQPQQRNTSNSVVDQVTLPYRGSSLPTGLGAQQRTTIDSDDLSTINKVSLTKQVTVGKLQLEEHEYSQRNIGRQTLYNDQEISSRMKHEIQTLGNHSTLSHNSQVVNHQNSLVTEESPVNIKINKYSAMSKHQNLKSETHDFLLSLIKKDGNPGSQIGQAYSNCFTNVPKYIRQYNGNGSPMANSPSQKALGSKDNKMHSISLQVNAPQLKQIKDEHLGFMNQNQHKMLSKHKKRNNNQSSISSEDLGNQGVTATILQLTSLLRDEELSKVSQKALAGPGLNKQGQPTVKKEHIQAAQVRIQPSSKHVQRLLSPVKRNFQLRNPKDANVLAAQIASMSVQGEATQSYKQLNQSLSFKASVRTLNLAQAQSPMDRSKTSTPSILCPKCSKIDSMNPVAGQKTVQEAKEELRCFCASSQNQKAPQDSHRDKSKKQLLNDQGETKYLASSNKALPFNNGNQNNESFRLSRLNLQIDSDVPQSSRNNSNVGTSDGRKTPKITSKTQNPSLRVHQLQQQQTEMAGSKPDLIKQVKTSARNKELTQATESIAKKKAIQPRQVSKQAQDKRKLIPPKHNFSLQNPSIRVHSLHDRVVNRNDYYEKLRHSYEQRLRQDHQSIEEPDLTISTIQSKSISNGASLDIKNRIAVKPLQLAKFVPIRQQHLGNSLTTKNANTGTSDLTLNYDLNTPKNMQDYSPTFDESQIKTLNQRSPTSSQIMQVGIMAGNQHSLKKNISIQNVIDGDVMFNHNETVVDGEEFVLSSAHSKTTMLVQSAYHPNEEGHFMTGSSAKGGSGIMNKRYSDQEIESPTISPLKARLQTLNGKKKSSKNLLKTEKQNLLKLQALKDPSNSGSRKHITSKLSQHHLNVNPSTIMSIGSHEMSTIRTGTVRKLKSDRGHGSSDSDRNRTLKGNNSSQNLCAEESEDKQFTSLQDQRKARIGSSSDNMFPSIDVKSRQLDRDGSPQAYTEFEQHLLAQNNISVMPLRSDTMKEKSLFPEKQKSEPKTPSMVNRVFSDPDSPYVDKANKTENNSKSQIKEKTQQRLVICHFQENLDLVDEVSKSSEYTQALQDSRHRNSTVRGLSSVISRVLESSQSSHSSLVSRNISQTNKARNSTLPSKKVISPAGITPLIHIVDQREYQENFGKIIEANQGLQDAINLTSRTPISNDLITAGAGTNAQSSAFSFYKLDDSISRSGGYAQANGTHNLIYSRESSARQGEDSFSFAKLRLGDTFSGVIVPDNPSLVMKSARYMIQKSEGGIQVTPTSREVLAEQAMDSFLEQIDLSVDNDKGNEDAQVQNVSSYLNVRCADSLLLLPNFKHEIQSLPVQHEPAYYRHPKTNPPVLPLSQPKLEMFQF